MDAPFIHGRLALADASDLIERFGEDAAIEASIRAERSRGDGNVARSGAGALSGNGTSAFGNASFARNAARFKFPAPST